MVFLGEFLCERLYEAGAHHLFSVPGDFSLGLLNEVVRSQIKYVGTCNELNAAYAADGYARVKGIGACVTTYAVGELSGLNGIAGAWAESVPVVCLVGAPARRFFQDMPLLHHTLGDYLIPMNMFKMITCAQALLNDPNTAAVEIDRVLNACLNHKKPVYIGVPSDMLKQEIFVPTELVLNPSPRAGDLTTTSKTERVWAPFVREPLPASDGDALAEAVDEIVSKLQQAKQPIMIPGIELIRRNLSEKVKELIVTANMPYATMLLSKGIIEERNSHFIGLHSGNRSRKVVKEYVDNSDCVLIVGERLTDFNTGGFTATFNPKTRIIFTYNSITISNHTYNNVYLHDVLEALITRFQGKPLTIHPEVTWPLARKGCIHRKNSDEGVDDFSVRLKRDLETTSRKIELNYVDGTFTVVEEGTKSSVDEELTMDYLFERMARFIPENAIVIAETGASLFSAAETMLPKGCTFIGQTFYGSIGYSVGGCLGAAVGGRDQNRQVVLFVGDGSFQVTAQDLSTMIRYGVTPTIFLVNNDGYTIERVITDNIYNDIQPWKYSDLPRVFGARRAGIKVHTQRELELALQSIEGDWNTVSKCDSETIKEPRLVEVMLDRWDCNQLLKEAGRTMARNNDLP